MAAPDSGNVLVGKPKVTGGVLAGPLTATLPTNASTAVGGTFVGLGYVSDAGLTQTIATETTNIVAWGGSTVRVVKTSHDVSYAVTLIETNPATLAEFYGIENVDTVDELTTVKINENGNGRRRYVFDMIDGDFNIRVVVPNGEVTETGDITYVDGEPIGYEITISAYPDPSGNKAYLYLQTPDLTP